jgi:transcriptional regulator with XRE-family HTH domain
MEKLKAKRIEKGLTQEALSALSGLRSNHISQIETGKKAATVKTLQKLADALGCPIGDLID